MRAACMEKGIKYTKQKDVLFGSSLVKVFISIYRFKKPGKMGIYFLCESTKTFAENCFSSEKLRRMLKCRRKV
jgi:hypothetical protein